MVSRDEQVCEMMDTLGWDPDVDHKQRQYITGILRDRDLYAESLRDDLKKAAEMLGRAKHSGICECPCCIEHDCPGPKGHGGSDKHADGCDVGTLIKRVETT